VDKRQELMAKMFQPGWTQPKYTVEQAGEMELRHALRGGGAASAPGGSDIHYGGQAKAEEAGAHCASSSSGDETDDDEDELRRKRDYDSWKDENPTGSGNTIGQG
jgi:TAP42-like family